MISSPPTLEARSIGRRVPGTDRPGTDHPLGADPWLLREVDLIIRPGSRVGLAGPSGGGKTLLLRALAYLDQLDAGELHWGGRPLLDHEIPAFRGRVMYLHQRPTLHEGTVEDNLRQPFLLRTHRQRSFDAGRIAGFLERLGRDTQFLTKDQHDLSGGERQLTALLRALQLDPQILLLDEPTTALDQQATEAVERLIGSWLSEAPRERSTLWVTHDRQQAERVADRIIHIEQGRLATGE